MYKVGDNRTQEPIQSKMSEIVFCDEDEYYCVNYLPFLEILEQNEKAEYCQKVHSHIIQVLSATTYSSIREKYVYLKKYFYRTFEL